MPPFVVVVVAVDASLSRWLAAGDAGELVEPGPIAARLLDTADALAEKWRAQCEELAQSDRERVALDETPRGRAPLSSDALNRIRDLDEVRMRSG